MRKLLLSIFLIFIGYFVSSQNLEIPAFGSDSTFEMMTWNIEHFPKNGQTTVDYVSEIILDLDIDLIAMQELEDTIVFNQMMTDLQDYEGYFQSSYFAGLAYIYNSEVISVDTIYEILTTQPYWRPFPRSPMVMELTFKGKEYIIINNHFKCCGDGILDINDDWDEEKRRLDASILLKEYIDDFFENDRVILTGDLNDDIADDPQNNVFNCYIDDPYNYQFVDMDIAQGDVYNWSYPTWPSHLDHILITNALFEDFSNEGSAVETLRIDDYFSSWSQYDYRVTDHRPVAIKIFSNTCLGEDELPESKNELSNYPNPIRNHTTISFTPINSSGRLIEIYNSKGRKIESHKLLPNQSSINWNANDVPGGIYILHLITDNKVIDVHKLVVVK